MNTARYVCYLKKINESFDNNVTSERNMKKQLIKSGVGMKTRYSHLNIITNHSLVKDIGMLKLFEPGIDKAEIQSKLPKILLCNGSTVKNSRCSTPVKGNFP